MPNKGNAAAGTKNPIVAIRFTAGDDIVEDVTSQASFGGVGDTAPGSHQSTSLSSSPSQGGGAGSITTDDSNWRKEFGGFFSRKRSGSTDNLSTVATTTAAATGAQSLSAGAAQPAPAMSTSTASESGSISSPSLGTWKLFKGKVSQAMEDITSAKQHAVNHSHQPSTAAVAAGTGSGGGGTAPIPIPCADADDSDADSATLNSSISDDFNEAAARTGGGGGGAGSDSDADLLDISHDSEAHVMKKTFDTLRSADILAAAGPSSKRTSLLSKLGRRSAEAAEWPSALRRRHHRHKSEREGRKQHRPADPLLDDEANIESGVEITEEMQLPATATTTSSDRRAAAATTATTAAGTTISHEIIVHGPAAVATTVDAGAAAAAADDTDTFVDVVDDDTMIPPTPVPSEGGGCCCCWTAIRMIPNKRLLLGYAVLFGMCWLWSVPAFVQGMLTCLCVMSAAQSLWQMAQPHIARYVHDRVFGADAEAGGDGGAGRERRRGPERGVFMVPDYAAMDEEVATAAAAVAVVVEQQQQQQCPSRVNAVKSYEGWMSTTHTYDPCNFHPSQARSVFVRLDGTRLHVAQPARGSRVPKRAVFAEPPIDVPLVGHREYELLAGTVELMPRGLARKRHFSRKYPIQLVVREAGADGLGSPARGAGPVDDDDHSSRDGQLADDERSFGDMIMFSDLQRLVADQHAVTKAGATTHTATTVSAGASPQHQPAPPTLAPPPPPPSADDVHVMLFARTDREKEDWYRRFVAASRGQVEDRQPTPTDTFAADMVFVHEDDCGAAAATTTATGTEVTADDASVSGAAPSRSHSSTRSSVADDASETSAAAAPKRRSDSSSDEPLLMSPSAGRGPADYVRFMGHYQRTRREQRKIQETADDLWRGVDRSLLTDTASTGGLLWANVLAGRVLFSCLNDAALIGHVQVLLQRKLSAIRLPGFMEEVRIAHVHLGDCPPLIHRVASPRVDERGTWIDADVTYEGLMHMTITTKLNLLRLRRQQADAAETKGDAAAAAKTGVTGSSVSPVDTPPDGTPVKKATTTTTSLAPGPRRQVEALFDSDAESSGASSSDSEASYVQNAVKSAYDPAAAGGTSAASAAAASAAESSSGGGSKKFLRIVDRIAASNLFQSAAEISYIQKAMENMSTAIKLRVELKGMVARCCVNLPPPPSDRVWLGFRGPPRLWLSATPALGDHTVDWSIVTGAIESKLCEELTKYLVYPNMVDLIVPQLGGATAAAATAATGRGDGA